MKVQCQCGAKYAFDVTPEMARDPVRFVCPGCGLDLSGPINELVRQELGLTPAAAPSPAPDRITIPAAAPRPPADTPAGPMRLSIARSASTATHGTPVETTPPPGATGDEGQPCAKHQGEFIVEHCRVCRKPLCPKCMELFGYVCSPLCKARAESHGIQVPVYARQKSVVEARQWRKIAFIGWGVGLVVVGLIVFWCWYMFYGSIPHPIFSVRFPEMAYAGSAQLCGQKQIVFLHGGILARYPLGSKTPVWTNQLITKEQLDAEMDRENKATQAIVADEVRRGVDSEDRVRLPTADMVMRDVQRELEASLSLFVDGQNIWVARNGELTRYDWDTGKPGQQVTMPGSYARTSAAGDELLFTDENAFGQPVITHFNLASGQTQSEEIGQAVSSAVLAEAARSSAGGAGNGGGTGLPTRPGGANSDKPLDPAKVARDAQNMPYAGRIALPATLANNMHQQEILNEIKSDEADPGRPPADKNAEPENPFARAFIQSKYGYVEWSSKMLERRLVSHSAMKAAPARSALEDNPTVGNTANVANEILNQMQRDRGGDVVTEDQSRYQVTIHRPDAKDVPDWTGEVTGEPAVIEQKTVTVVRGGDMFVVLDKSNKKLWQADLTHQFAGGSGFDQDDPGETSLGQGPCVEHGDTLYVFDEATLTAYEVANGNVRWRVPSIGIAGVFFDDNGAMYVNSTTGDLESIKYSRQIDITKKISASVLKIDCQSGKVLWNVQPGSFVSHVDGKFVLCYAVHQAPDDIDPDALTTLPGMADSEMILRRLDPKTGKTMWEYPEPRAPLYVRFHGNIIELVFRKEVEVLKFISL